MPPAAQTGKSGRNRGTLADDRQTLYKSRRKTCAGLQFDMNQFLGRMSLAAVALFAAAGFAQARVTGDAAVLANAITALQGAGPPLDVTTTSFTPSPRDTVPGTLNDKYTADRG